MKNNTNTKQRLHWSVMIEDSLGFFAGLSALALVNLDDAISALRKHDWNLIATISEFEKTGIPLWAAVCFFAVLIFLVFLFHFVKWRNTFVSFEQDTVIFERGRLVRQKSTIATDTIASVQMQKNLFRRLMGTSRIKFDLNSGGADITRLKIVLKDKDAQSFRNQILKRYADASFEVEDYRRYSLVDFGMAGVLRHYLLNMNLIVIAFAVAFYVFMTVAELSEARSQGRFGFLLASFVIIVPMIYRSVMNFLSFFQFMVYRKGDTIVLTYGLVTHSVYELPVSRINAVRIKQSLQARIFKKYCLEVVNAGLGDEKDEKQVLCLYVNRATLLHLMHQLLPEYKLDENAIRQPKTALLLSLPTVLIVSVFLGVLAYYLTPWCLIALPLTMLIPFLRSFTLSLATGDDCLSVGHGVFSRVITILRIDRIERFGSSEPWMARRLGLKNLSVSVIGDSIQTGHFPTQLIDSAIDRIRSSL